MPTTYLFDVDGTLTPSRGVITDEFKELFEQFCEANSVYIVSGSDYAKTKEQLGEEITTTLVKRVYNCSGNSIWQAGHEIYNDPWTLPITARQYLTAVLDRSQCPTKTGQHFEDRPGAVNFSTVGRNANNIQRAEYIQFDTASNERKNLVNAFNRCYGDKLGCVAVIGGETGIDITRIGGDKSQILRDFTDVDVTFFGDKCNPGGNDYPLASAILERQRQHDTVYNVSCWQDTMHYLTHIC